MKKSFLLNFAFLFFITNCFSQTEYKKFIDNFVQLYKSNSQSPSNNIYQVLVKTTDVSFNPQNPIFLSALSEIRKDYASSELAALDTLFYKSYRELKTKYLWVGAENIIAKDEKILSISNESLCNCLNSTVDTSLRNLPFSLNKELPYCTTKLMTDSNFLNKLKKIEGEKSINELSELRPYFARYFFGNCPLINKSFTFTVINGNVYSKYFPAIDSSVKNLFIKIIAYDNKKQFDSLSLIFPKYKNYISEIRKAANATKVVDNHVNSVHYGGENGNLTTFDISIINGFKNVATVIIETTSRELKPQIASFKFNKINDNPSNNDTLQSKFEVPPPINLIN